jgi:hypothetical protein
MTELQQLIQSYIGMRPQDKGCENYAQMQQKMEKEIQALFQEEIKLFAYKDFILTAVNFYWYTANQNLTERKGLGDIERENYTYQLNNSKEIIKLLDK